jgi:hypothetical protein
LRVFAATALKRKTAVKACPFCAADTDDAAVACTHCHHELTDAPRRRSHAILRWVGIGVATWGVLLAVMIVSVVYRSDRNQGGVAAAALAPMTLTDVVENLPANSWRAIPVKVPYSGTLRVELDVVRGNPLNAYLVSAEEFSAFQENDAATPRTYEGFKAANTKTFHREAPFNSGEYYFLIVYPSSSPSVSDVAVQIAVRP